MEQIFQPIVLLCILKSWRLEAFFVKSKAIFYKSDINLHALVTSMYSGHIRLCILLPYEVSETCLNVVILLFSRSLGTKVLLEV